MGPPEHVLAAAAGQHLHRHELGPDRQPLGGMGEVEHSVAAGAELTEELIVSDAVTFVGHGHGCLPGSSAPGSMTGTGVALSGRASRSSLLPARTVRCAPAATTSAPSSPVTSRAPSGGGPLLAWMPRWVSSATPLRLRLRRPSAPASTSGRCR